MTKEQEALAAAIRSATIDYQIGGKPDVVERLTAPITYVLDGDGVFEVRKSAIGISATKATKVMGLADVLQEGFSLTLPKLPWRMFQEAIAFFRWACQEHNSEATLQGWFDRTTQAWFWFCPEQDVSGASVHYEGTPDERPTSGDLVYALTIHSHSKMAAFFSSVDDLDEQQLERICAVVGKLDERPTHPSRWRLWSGTRFIELKLEDIVDLPSEPVSVRIPFVAWLFGQPVKVTGDPFADTTFPEAWKAKVKAGWSYSVRDNRRSWNQPSMYGGVGAEADRGFRGRGRGRSRVVDQGLSEEQYFERRARWQQEALQQGFTLTPDDLDALEDASDEGTGPMTPSQIARVHGVMLQLTKKQEKRQQQIGRVGGYWVQKPSGQIVWYGPHGEIEEVVL